jgi:hypothetical protein
MLDSPSPWPLNFYRSSKKPSLISSSMVGSSSFSRQTNSGSVAGATGGWIYGLYYSRVMAPTPEASLGEMKSAFPWRRWEFMLYLEFYACLCYGYWEPMLKPWPICEMPPGIPNPVLGLRDLKLGYLKEVGFPVGSSVVSLFTERRRSTFA